MTKNYTTDNQHNRSFLRGLLPPKGWLVLVMFFFALSFSYGQSVHAIINLKHNGSVTTHSLLPNLSGCPTQAANGKFEDVIRDAKPGDILNLGGQVVMGYAYGASGDVQLYYRLYREGDTPGSFSMYGLFRDTPNAYGSCGYSDHTLFDFRGTAGYTGDITIPATGGTYYLEVYYYITNGGVKHGGINYTAQFNVDGEDIYLSSNGTGYKMGTTDGNAYTLNNVYITGTNGYFYNVYNGSTTKYWSHTCWNTAGTNCTANDPTGSVPGTKIPTTTGVYNVTFNKTTKVYTFTAVLAASQQITSAKVNMQVYNDSDESTNSYWYYLNGAQPTLDCHKDVGNLEFNNVSETPTHTLTPGSTVKIGGEVRTNNNPIPVKMHYRVYKKDADPLPAFTTRTLTHNKFLTSGTECGNQGGQNGVQTQILASSGATETFATEGEYYVEVYYSALGTVPDNRNGLGASNITMIGDAISNWSTDVAMGSPITNIYQLFNTSFVATGSPPGCKFRQDANWSNNWGNTTFPAGTAIHNSGGDIPATAGTYNVTFDKISLKYVFTPYSATEIYFNNNDGSNYKALIKVVAVVDESNEDTNDGNFGFTDATTDPGCTNCTGLYESYMGLLITDAQGATVANQVYNLDGARGSANTSNVRLGSQYPGITFKIGTEIKAWARGRHKMCGCSSWFYVYDLDDTDPVESDFPLPSEGSEFTALKNGKFTLMNTSKNLGTFHTPIPLNPENTSGMGSGVIAGSVSDDSDDSGLPRRKYELLLRDLNLQGYNNTSNSTYSLIGGFSGGTDVNFTNVSGKDKDGGGTYATEDRMLYDYYIGTSNEWMKIRNNGAWTESYGSSWTWPDGNATPGGGDITSVPAGNYTILFNYSTRKLQFSKTTLYRWKDFTNAATTQTVNAPVYEVACPSCGGEYKVAVALLCWASNNHDCTDESTFYYHRDINQNKTYKGISLNPHHPDALDKPTNGAADNTLPGTKLFYVQSISILDSGRENRWNGTEWSQTGSSKPEKYDDVYIDSDITITPTGATQSFTCVNLVVSDGATLTIPNNRYVEVLQQASTSGTGKIVIGDSGNFVQRCNNLAGQAYIEHSKPTREIAPRDYAYWSSPIQEDMASILSDAGMGRMFYWKQSINNWAKLVSTDPAVGIGYGTGFIAWNPTTDTQDFLAQINGTVNSGVIEVPVVNYDADVNNTANYALLGNPYPCALDAQEFLLANENLDGTLYFWTSNSRIRTGGGTNGGVYTCSESKNFCYNPADYAQWNLTGGTATAAAALVEGEIGNDSAPTQFIGSGVGFFAFVLESGDVEYNNDMRRTSGNSYTTFKSKEEIPLDKSRLWLNISNNSGDFRQAVIGYLDGATIGRDRLYDSRVNSVSRTLIYTKADGQELAIQGRPKELLNSNETIPLCIRTSIADEFFIFIDHLDGKFTSKEIFLRDKKMDIEHNLSEERYVFTTETGTYEDRFELFYKDKPKPSIEEPADVNAPLKVAVSDHLISISKAGQKIAKVELVNILGKQIAEKLYKESSEKVEIHDIIKANQVLILKVTYADGSKETKKIIF